MNLENVIAVRENKTIYRDGDKCIKVFNADYSKADVLNEALNQARIEETGLNIPKLLGITMIDGRWAVVSEYIEGKSLAKLMEEEPEKKEEYINLFVNLQMSIHSKTCMLLNKLKDKLILKIADTELDATTRYDLYTRLEGMPKHNKVCHGDFNPSNVIISESGTPYIIDWSHATKGNASADVALTYILFCLSGDTSGAERYMDAFCRKSHTARQYISKWLPIVAAARSATENENEAEILSGFVSAVDYQ